MANLRAPDRVVILPETQPIPCQFSLWCKGFRARWTIARGPARPTWIHLCDRCLRELLASVPAELLPGGKAEEPAQESPATTTVEVQPAESVAEEAGAEEETEPQARPPSEGETVLTCACGQEFRGKTAAANYARHKRTCPAAQEAEAQ